MGIFERKTCARCGKELGLIFGKIKIADGHICKDCNALLSPYLSNKSKLTLNDIENHIKYREQNKIALNSFKATTTFDSKDKVFVDETNKKFIVSADNKFVEKNLDIFSFNEISTCELKIDEDQKEIFTTDKDGNEISYNPAKYDTLYTYKIELTLTHKWCKSLEIEVYEDEINANDQEKLLEVDNLANEIVAKLTGKEFVAKTATTETTTDDQHWTCAKCGHANELTSKFCTECGEAKPSGQKFCGECGTKLPEGTKFCPNCGKAVG